MLLFGFEHHCKNNSLENPDSMSAELANTTLGLETLLNSCKLWHNCKCLNWKGLFLAPSKLFINLSLIHSICDFANSTTL